MFMGMKCLVAAVLVKCADRNFRQQPIPADLRAGPSVPELQRVVGVGKGQSSTASAVNVSHHPGSLILKMLKHPIKVGVHDKRGAFAHSTDCLVEIGNILPLLI